MNFVDTSTGELVTGNNQFNPALFYICPALLEILLVENCDEKSVDLEGFAYKTSKCKLELVILGEYCFVRLHPFNYGEFAIIKSQAGLNNYKLSIIKI